MENPEDKTGQEAAGTTEGQEGLSQQEAGASSEAGTQTEAKEGQEQVAAPTVEEMQKKNAELEAKNKEIQAEATKASQEAAEAKKLLEVVTPFWEDESQSGPARDQAQTPSEEDDLGVSGGEEDGGYISRAEHKKALKAVVNQVSGMLNVSAFKTKFRKQYPDLGDNGPKEKLLDYYFSERLKKGDSRESALKGAIDDARAFVESEREEGAKTARTEQEKIAAEADKKAKAGAAAAAAGIGSSGISAPTKVETPPTQKEQLQSIRAEKEKKKNITPI